MRPKLSKSHIVKIVLVYQNNSCQEFYPDPVNPLDDTHGAFSKDTTENNETEKRKISI